MEASTLQAPAGLARHRIAIGIPLLRLRSDEQLVALFRAGHDEAFRVIHDRYEKRLLAYTRQMLPRGQDAEDAIQDVFVRAYSGLRSSERELALRAWLFRVAHNRCIDELRRPLPPAPEVLQLTSRAVQDPVAEVEGRESLRRLIIDVRRLPDQQRSVLLMREMGGMSYAELAGSLGTSVPAVKSLLVRARVALAQAAAARDTACSDIREELAEAHDRGVRPNATAKRHMRDCAGCRGFRRELRAVNRRLAALAPLGPFALAAKAFGFSGGASASSGATAGGAGGATAGGATASGGAAAFSGAASGGGALASGAVVVGSGHVATLLAAAVATAGGAVAISAPPTPTSHVRPVANVQSAGPGELQAAGAGVAYQAAGVQDGAASAVGASLVVQANAKSASQAAGSAGPKRAGHAMAPSSASTSTTTPPMTADSSSGIAPPPTDPASSLGMTLNGGSDPSSAGTTSTDPGSTTGSSGSATGSGGSAGTSTGTATQSSGSSSSGSTGTSGSGSSTGTSGSGSGTSGSGSTTSTGTSPDAGSSSSGSGTSTSK